MKQNPNKKYLLINLVLIAIEGIIVLLAKLKILMIGFDLDGRRNINVLLFIIVTQLFFLYLVSLSEDEKNQRNLYLGQIVLFVCIAVWVFLKIEHYY